MVENMVGASPPQCVSLYGPRRIGKTSIALCAQALAPLSNGSLTPLVLYEDAAAWLGKDDSQLLRRFVTRLGERVGFESARNDPADALQELLELTTETDVRVTIIIDEVGRAA